MTAVRIPPDIEAARRCFAAYCVLAARVKPERIAPAGEPRPCVTVPRARPSHCKHGHALSADNVTIWADGRYRCRACQRAREAARGPRKHVRGRHA